MKVQKTQKLACNIFDQKFCPHVSTLFRKVHELWLTTRPVAFTVGKPCTYSKQLFKIQNKRVYFNFLSRYLPLPLY